MCWFLVVFSCWITGRDVGAAGSLWSWAVPHVGTQPWDRAAL